MNFEKTTTNNPNKQRILPLWIETWLITSAIICLLDVGFTMLRPHTTTGGSLATVYYGWNIYADVDKRYADPHDQVTTATGRVMLIEIVMDFVVFFMARRQSRHTVLTAFTTSCFVFWKTVLYLVLFIAPPQGISHFSEEASSLRIFWVFWVMNGIWVIMPFMVMMSLWSQLIQPKNFASTYELCESEIAEPEKIIIPENSH
ncbi:unnamed protein product [Auanema sp. JU1783]|nr:unnamed protein product [Auanema sp. JU1783]